MKNFIAIFPGVICTCSLLSHFGSNLAHMGFVWLYCRLLDSLCHDLNAVPLPIRLTHTFYTYILLSRQVPSPTTLVTHLVSNCRIVIFTLNTNHKSIIDLVLAMFIMYKCNISTTLSRYLNYNNNSILNHLI